MTDEHWTIPDVELCRLQCLMIFFCVHSLRIWWNFSRTFWEYEKGHQMNIGISNNATTWSLAVALYHQPAFMFCTYFILCILPARIYVLDTIHTWDIFSLHVYFAHILLHILPLLAFINILLYKIIPTQIFFHILPAQILLHILPVRIDILHIFYFTY